MEPFAEKVGEGLILFIRDFTNDISTFGNAMETVNEGIILTDEQMRKLSQSTEFCNDDIESLTEGMIDLHPELAEVRKEFGLWDVYPETLSNIAQGVGLIKDGTVDAGKAFDEFRKPMWGMTEDALAFFGQVQDGTIIEAPLDTITQANEKAILNVFSKLGISAGNNKNSGNETFVFQVDGKTFFEITRKYAEEYFNCTGCSPYPI